MRTPAREELLPCAAERSRWSRLGSSGREEKVLDSGDRQETWVGPGEGEPGVKNDSEVVGPQPSCVAMGVGQGPPLGWRLGPGDGDKGRVTAVPCGW